MPSRHTSEGNPERELLERDRQLELAHRVPRFWWIGVLRGAVAFLLGLSALLASSSPERLPTFLALYWLAGGVVTLRLAWAVRPSLGFRLAAVAGGVAIAGAFEIERGTGQRWSIGGLILGVLEVGTGILLIATDPVWRGVMITVGVWALVSGTLLIVEAISARRRASALLGPRTNSSPQPTAGQP